MRLPETDYLRRLETIFLDLPDNVRWRTEKGVHPQVLYVRLLLKGVQCVSHLPKHSLEVQEIVWRQVKRLDIVRR